MAIVQARLLSEEEAENATPLVQVALKVNLDSIDKNRHSNLKRIWDNYKVIGEVQKAAKTKFVVAAAIRDGIKYINIREFYLHRDIGEWMPNPRAGITVPLLYPIFDFEANKIVDTIVPFSELANLMFEAAETLEDMYLFDEANAVFVERKKKGNKDGSNH